MHGSVYVDEVKQDRELGKVRVRHLEKLPFELETTIETMNDFYRLGQLLQSRERSQEASQEAIKIIKKYVNLYSCSSGDDLRKALAKRVQEIQKEQSQLFESEKTDAFFKELTDGRYPSFFTLNHAGSAEPQAEINGGVYVCTFKNMFWDGQGKLYVFGPRNERFKDYLRKVREAAEEIEGPEFFKGLPLEVTKEQIRQYVESNPDAMIIGKEHKNPEEARRKYGTDFVISPKSPVGLTRINGRVKEQDLGELLIACFLGEIEERGETKIGDGEVTIAGFDRTKTFKGNYYGRDNIEAVTVLYSGLPYAGLGDWGGRIEISPNEVTPEVYRDFKDAGYRFGDLAELVIDLRNRKIIFFNEK